MQRRSATGPASARDDFAGFVRVRQRILGLREEQWDDNTPCAALLLDPTLVPVEARPMKPFQGWRYLKPEEAPADVAAQLDEQFKD